VAPNCPVGVASRMTRDGNGSGLGRIEQLSARR
jgi:hypothetical protein